MGQSGTVVQLHRYRVISVTYRKRDYGLSSILQQISGFQRTDSLVIGVCISCEIYFYVPLSVYA